MSCVATTAAAVVIVVEVELLVVVIVNQTQVMIKFVYRLVMCKQVKTGRRHFTPNPGQDLLIPLSFYFIHYGFFNYY